MLQYYEGAVFGPLFGLQSTFSKICDWKKRLSTFFCQISGDWDIFHRFWEFKLTNWSEKTKGNTHIWFSEKIYIQFLTRPSFRSIWYHWEILDRRVEHRLEIKGRVQKFFKRAPEHENVLRIQLKINKSEKEHLILENQKVSIQYLNAKTTYIRARGGQFFFLKTHNKTSLYKYTAIIGLKQSSRVRTYSLLPCWFDFYNTICCIRKAHELSF